MSKSDFPLYRVYGRVSRDMCNDMRVRVMAGIPKSHIARLHDVDDRAVDYHVNGECKHGKP